MSIRLEISEFGWISLREYVEYVDRAVDVWDEEAVLSSAPYFAALLGNRSLLSHVVDMDALRLEDAEPSRPLKRYSVLLGEGERKQFSLHAHLWLPTAPEAPIDLGGSYCPLLAPHDHRASLMIGGYSGEGCLHEMYDRAESGETRLVRNARLEQGDIIYFVPGRDIHVLTPPSKPSISLRLTLPGVDPK